MKAFALELYKCRRKHLWAVTAGMIGVQGLWLLWAMRKADVKELSQGYAACLYQFPLLNAIVLPVLTAILVSRLCDMEHRGGALKALLTMERPAGLFGAKLACAALYLALGVVAQLCVIRLAGWIYGFQDTLAVRDCLLYLLAQWLTSVFLALVVQGLALKYVNQFIPMVAGLVLGFLGLMSLFFPPVVMRLVPSSYYGLLSTVNMDWDQATRVVTYYAAPFSASDWWILATATVVLFGAECRFFAKREV